MCESAMRFGWLFGCRRAIHGEPIASHSVWHRWSAPPCPPRHCTVAPLIAAMGNRVLGTAADR
jgi:hypothetical protein